MRETINKCVFNFTKQKLVVDIDFKRGLQHDFKDYRDVFITKGYNKYLCSFNTQSIGRKLSRNFSIYYITQMEISLENILLDFNFYGSKRN